ncbi:hypothetical protein GCM10009678_51580 [Actinomadura kijaniata]|uniref:Putative membrane protein YphA (DoxX/SURF4 family) n=1 Tax=Actinomadura namibiensis TaxID=182080 RepID=A0A7W3LL35_ACTNM|nr:DoxX family protein [Actinomadura namibiensis]MBA8950063.1 putative membrane protein YphA (DoxX/SURF4 family) [Actinomadura namibiensis]
MSHPSPTRRRGRAATVVAWVLQVLLALEFLAAGLGKLLGSQANVDMFAEIGAGQWLRYLVGVLEVAGAVGVVLPPLAALAAACLAALMVGAIITDLAVIEESPVIPAVALAMAVAVAVLRRDDFPALRDRLRRSG